jgi:hypothetical protein
LKNTKQKQKQNQIEMKKVRKLPWIFDVVAPLVTTQLATTIPTNHSESSEECQEQEYIE